VAVVGASSDLQGLRGRILEVMLSHPYAGTIYPVSRSTKEVQGRKAYASVTELPQAADLAILIIPAEFVPEELERCGRAGVKAAVILSSGFAEEPGETGLRMQEALRATAERYDMAVVGPNAEGFANKLWFPSIDHVTNEPVGVPARVSAQVAVDSIGFTNSSFMPTFWPGTLSSIVILPLPSPLPLHAHD